MTDCYSGYNAQVAGAKQKCLAHLARTAGDWQKLVVSGSADDQFFNDVRAFVKRGTRLHHRRKDRKLKGKALETEIKWLRNELERLSLTDAKDEKAIQLQGRILRHLPEWLVFIDDPRVSPTNNLAERAIRPLVVLRKITFGSRSLEGGERMADLMTVAETARRHGHRASDIYYGLFTRPPNQVLRSLYASASWLRGCRRPSRLLRPLRFGRSGMRHPWPSDSLEVKFAGTQRRNDAECCVNLRNSQEKQPNPSQAKRYREPGREVRTPTSELTVVQHRTKLLPQRSLSSAIAERHRNRRATE